MVLYFFAASILALPRARTLWTLSPAVETQAIVWTLVAVATSVVLGLESINKRRSVVSAYKQASKEYTSSFWARSFFIWMLPLFQSGFSSILALHDMPEVDRDLQGGSAEDRLLETWSKSKSTQVLERLADEDVRRTRVADVQFAFKINKSKRPSWSAWCSVPIYGHF